MSHPDRLIWLTFAADRRTIHFPGIRITNRSQISPELGCNASVIGVTDSFGQFAIFDQFGVLTAKLKLVPPVAAFTDIEIFN